MIPLARKSVPATLVLTMLAVLSIFSGCGPTSAEQAADVLEQGRLYHERDDLDAAIRCYTLAIALDPMNAQAYACRASARFIRGDCDGALADWTDAIRLDGASADAYKGRAALYIHQKDYGRALADLNEAVQLDPHDEVSNKARAEVYVRVGQGAETDILP